MLFTCSWVVVTAQVFSPREVSIRTGRPARTRISRISPSGSAAMTLPKGLGRHRERK
jgi:hypothetical protein